MKTSLTLFFSLIIILCAFNQIESKKKNVGSKLNTKLKIKNKNHQEPEKQYDAYNFQKASDGGNKLRDMEGYNTPTFVEDINKSGIENFDAYKAKDTYTISDEKPSLKNYYDGELNLTAARVVCGNFKIPKQCNTFNHCGWCGSSKTCIEGNKEGPIEPCNDRKSYLYGKDYYNEVNKEIEDMKANVEKME